MQNHILFLVYISSMAAAKVALVLCLLFYFRLRQGIILNFTFFLYGIASRIFAESVILYGILTGLSPDSAVMRIMPLILGRLSFVILSLNFPVFGFLLAGRRHTQTSVRIFSFFAFLTVTTGIFRILFPDNPVLRNLEPALLLFSYCAFAVFGIVSWLKAGEYFQAPVRLLFFLSAVFSLPVLLPAESFSTLFSFVYLIIVSLGTIVLGIAVFRLPGNLDRATTTEYLRKRFRFSERETEVAFLILKGFTARSIGEKLYISPKTVQNHVANIYQKTGVNSRFQLIHLIQASIGIIT